MDTIPHFMPIDPRDPGSIERGLTRLNRQRAEALREIPRPEPVDLTPAVPAVLSSNPIEQMARVDGQVAVSKLVDQYGLDLVYRWLKNEAVALGLSLPSSGRQA